MNCKQYKEKLTDTLAAGETTLPAELSAHQQACADCRAFYESQAGLFRSMDAGLRAVANQPVHPSFLPSVRAHLDQQASSLRPWFPGWGLVAVAATAIFAVTAGLLWHRPVVPPGLPEDAPVISQAMGNPILAVQPPPSLPAASRDRTHRRVKPVASPAKVSEAELEIIVLPEEREAFARFVAKLPEQKEVALALTRPAPVNEDAPVEIALLDLGSVEVKPLESEARQ